MMSDVERARGWLADGTLLHPRDGPNTVDLASAMALLCGAGDGTEGEASGAIAETVGPAEHYVFVLIDGLGMNLIERLAPESFLRSHLAMELRAVCPATTAAGLTSLGTALWPSEHSVIGWWLYLPDRALSVTALPFVERLSERPLGELGVDASEVYPRTAAFARFDRTVRLLHPRSIADSTYTRYFSAGAGSGAYERLRDGVDAAAEAIARCEEPSYTYLYYPSVDTMEHVSGPASEEVLRHAEAVDRALAALRRTLPATARIVLTADHGMLAAEELGKHAIEPGDELLELLVAPPSGEPRMPLFHVKEGRVEAFASRFRERYGARFALLTADEVEALELLGPGPLAAETRARLGEFLALSHGADALIYNRPGARTPVMDMRGFHAGMRPDEMRIPLVIAY